MLTSSNFKDLLDIFSEHKFDILLLATTIDTMSLLQMFATRTGSEPRITRIKQITRTD